MMTESPPDSNLKNNTDCNLILEACNNNNYIKAIKIIKQHEQLHGKPATFSFIIFISRTILNELSVNHLTELENQIKLNYLKV